MRYLRIIGAMMLLAVSLLAMTGCQEPASPLEDYTWELVRYGKPGSIGEALPDVTVTAYFNSRDKTVSGNGGCNAYSGTYTASKADLTINTPLIRTEMACGGAVDQQENEYFKLLQAADRFELERGMLYIYSGDARLVFQRSDAPPPDIKQWGE